jgi:6-pyruvoyltetrahydropterin/6-carboxytetrahydropterin synthase
MTKIATSYDFCSAHWLPYVADDHKCKRLHGHNYKLWVLIEGEVGDDGMLIDFFQIDKVVAPLVKQVDHYELNGIRGLENPTAELISLWFARKIAGALGRPVTCRLFETPECWAEYTVIP